MGGDTDRLYERALYWLYKKGDSRKAKKYTRRLRRVVEDSDPGGEAIFTQECLSLACEAEGELKQAIFHREEEIRFIRRLHELARGIDAAHADYLLDGYSQEDLQDRLDLLECLREESLQ